MADNVTPIRPPERLRKSRRSKERIGVKLTESEPETGFCTLDVVNGLHGICVALDESVVSNSNFNNTEYLVQAAKVLSAIIQDRWTS
jgi:hypothetical protein